MSEIEAGQTAGGNKGIDQQLSMMGSREAAYLYLQANPPPIPVGWKIPVSKEEE